MEFKKKPAFKRNYDEDKEFDQTRRKYSTAIIYLLINNIASSSLGAYFADEDNQTRLNAIKELRRKLLSARPKARQYLDKPFYLNIKIAGGNSDDGHVIEAKDQIFKQTTKVVANDAELQNYLGVIDRLLDGDRLWDDPLMENFQQGIRSDFILKEKQETKAAAE